MVDDSLNVWPILVQDKSCLLILWQILASLNFKCWDLSLVVLKNTFFVAQFHLPISNYSFSVLLRSGASVCQSSEQAHFLSEIADSILAADWSLM